jgi:hypothetical protein
MTTVALAVTDGMLHFELSLAYEVFGAVPDGVTVPWYEVTVCGSAPVRVAGSGSNPITVSTVCARRTP